MPRVRPRPTAAQSLAKAARAGQPVQRVELPPRVTCPRCGGDQWPDDDGNPRWHERAARPGDEMYSPEWPVMVACEPPAMTLEDLHAALPDELRVTPEMVPEDLAAGLAYLVARDALIEDGVPLAEVPAFRDWRADRA